MVPLEKRKYKNDDVLNNANIATSTKQKDTGLKTEQ